MKRRDPSRSDHESAPRDERRFERALAHPPAKVWRALTDESSLAAWFPASIEGEREEGANVTFVPREGDGPTEGGTITEYDPPNVFAYTWGGATFRWELHETAGGCTLVFTTTETTETTAETAEHDARPKSLARAA